MSFRVFIAAALIGLHFRSVVLYFAIMLIWTKEAELLESRKS